MNKMISSLLQHPILAVLVLNFFPTIVFAQSSTSNSSSTTSSTTTASSPTSTSAPYICGNEVCDSTQYCFLDPTGVQCLPKSTTGCYLKYEPYNLGGHIFYGPREIPDAVYDGQFWEWNGPSSNIGEQCTQCIVPSNVTSLEFYSVQPKMIAELSYGGSCIGGWCGNDSICHAPVDHYHSCQEDIQCGFGVPIQGHNVSMTCIPHDNSTTKYCVYDPNDNAFSQYSLTYPDSDTILFALSLRAFLTFLIPGLFSIFFGIIIHLFFWQRKAARARRTNQRVQMFMLNVAARRADDQKDPAFIAAEDAARPVTWRSYMSAKSSRFEIIICFCFLIAGVILLGIAGTKASPPWAD